MKIIDKISIDTSNVKKDSTTRAFTVYGDVGSVFSLHVVNSNNNFYNFSTEAFQATPVKLVGQEIGNNGIYTNSIKFPTISSNDEYNIYFFANSHYKTVFSDDLGGGLLYKVPNFSDERNADGTIKFPSSIYQFLDTTITITAAHSTTGFDTGAFSNATFSGLRRSVFSQNINQLENTSIPNRINVSFTFATNDQSKNFSITRQPVLKDFEITKTHTVNGAITSSNSVVLDDVSGVTRDMDITAVSSGSLAASTTVTTVDVENKIVNLSQNNTFADGITLTFTGKGVAGVKAINGTSLKISDLSIALPTVNNADTGQTTNFNVVTKKASGNLTSGTTVDVVSTTGIRAGNTILADGLTTADGTDTGTPITVASVTDNNTIEFTSALQNNSIIYENTNMYFSGSASSGVTFTCTIDVLSLADDDFTLTLNLDNILNITDSY